MIDYVKKRSVDCFTGKNKKGNSHLAVLVEKLSNQAKAAEQSLKIAPLIYVETSIDSDSVANIRCYQYGKEVQNCGSGILAAFALLNGAGNSTAIVKKFKNKVVSGEYLSKGNLLGYRLKLKTVIRKKYRNQALWQSICGQNIKSIYETSDNNYIIAELKSSLQVRKLRPRMQLLMRQKPALIITAPNNQTENEYLVRYFAPQYGNDEDAATGSANALLMKFWASRMSKNKMLTGQQLSQSGGEFFGFLRGGEVELFGRVVVA